MEERSASPHPTVTVLMAVRDGERHLRPALESILHQTFDDFEFLIVDDASADATRELIEGYRDPRIRLVANAEHLGLTGSLNRGIALARGRYLARMDADDLSARERLERQVAFLDAHPECALVATWARKIDADGAQVGVAHTPLTADATRRLLRRGNCITHGTVMIRGEALRCVGGYDPSMQRAQDYDLWLRLSERFDLGTLPEYLYAWREHAASISGRHLAEQDRFAELARRRALRRRLQGRLDRLVAEGASDAALAREMLALLREERESRAPPAAGSRPARWLQRALRSAGGCWIRERRQRSSVRRALRELAAGRTDAAATAAALAALVEGPSS